MSNLYTRLRTIFSPKLKPTKLIKPKQILKSTPTQNSSIHNGIEDLLDEKDSHKLVEKFKSLSQHTYFRQRYKIYETVIHRLTLSKNYSLIEDALESQKNYMCSEGFGSRIIHLYGKAGMFDHARKAFDEMPERGFERGAKSLSALLSAAVKCEDFDKVYGIFRDVPSRLSIEPNVECYNSAIHALCKVGLFDQAVGLIDEMKEKGLEPCVVSYNTILGAFYGKGKFEEGEKVWERMVGSGVEPDIMSFDFKLYGLVNDGKVSKAIDLAMELKSKGLKPDVGTFNALVLGSCKNDDLNQVRRWYMELLNNGFVPNRVTFDTIVPFLCDRNDYGFAFEVCKRMFRRQCSVDATILQRVVDGLVKNSMIGEAKNLVGLGKANSFYPYDLVMPACGLSSSFL